MNLKNSKQHSHGDSDISDSQAIGHVKVASSSTLPDKTEIEYGINISSLERSASGVETALYEEVNSSHRGK
jgi:hypothetical protein